MVAVSSHEAGNQALLEASADGVCPKTPFSEIVEVSPDSLPPRID